MSRSTNSAPLTKPASGPATTAANINPATGVTVKRRKPGAAKSRGSSAVPAEEEPGGREADETDADAKPVAAMAWATRNQWMVYAVASGACAAFNGVFAKL